MCFSLWAWADAWVGWARGTWCYYQRLRVCWRIVCRLRTPRQRNWMVCPLFSSRSCRVVSKTKGTRSRKNKSELKFPIPWSWAWILLCDTSGWTAHTAQAWVCSRLSSCIPSTRTDQKNRDSASSQNLVSNNAFVCSDKAARKCWAASVHARWRLISETPENFEELSQKPLRVLSLSLGFLQLRESWWERLDWQNRTTEATQAAWKPEQDMNPRPSATFSTAPNPGDWFNSGFMVSWRKSSPQQDQFWRKFRWQMCCFPSR